jgi:hypothetical protein
VAEVSSYLILDRTAVLLVVMERTVRTEEKQLFLMVHQPIILLLLLLMLYRGSELGCKAPERTEGLYRTLL